MEEVSALDKLAECAGHLVPGTWFRAPSLRSGHRSVRPLWCTAALTAKRRPVAAEPVSWLPPPTLEAGGRASRRCPGSGGSRWSPRRRG
jgi:hypothetical protein